MLKVILFSLKLAKARNTESGLPCHPLCLGVQTVAYRFYRVSSNNSGNLNSGLMGFLGGIWSSNKLGI